MSDAVEEVKAAVRLRVPERRRMVMVVQCPGNLVGPTRSVRSIMAGIEQCECHARSLFFVSGGRLQQSRPEVHHVVGQRAPQGHAFYLRQAADDRKRWFSFSG